MELNNSPVITARQINCRIVNNFESFKFFCNSHIPGVIKTDCHASLQHQEHFSECLLPLCRQYYVEDITDIVAKGLGVNILFAKSSLDGKHYNVIGFAKPTQEEMYLLIINSDMYGIVDEIAIVLYDSIENFLYKIRDLYQRTERENAMKKVLVLEAIKTEDIYKIFYN